VYADACVCCPWAAGYKANSWPASQPAIRFCHVGGCALVFSDDDLDFRHIVESIKHVQIAFARNAKHSINAVDPDRVGQNAASASGSGGMFYSMRCSLVPAQLDLVGHRL
jgi:hypothetical protein